MKNFESMMYPVHPKEREVQKVRAEIDHIVDAEGKGIDEGIKEIVVALEVSGLRSQASCEGHTNKGQISAPWVEIGAPNEPDERFVGQNEIFRLVANERGLSFEKVKRSFDPDAYWEAMKRMSEQETSEFREWKEQNTKLFEKTKKKVEEFYRQYGEPEEPETKIQFDDGYVGNIFRIYSGTKDYTPIETELTQDEQEEVNKRLVRYRAEMERFSKFLLGAQYQ